jgi:type II secretion system protein H
MADPAGMTMSPTGMQTGDLPAAKAGFTLVELVLVMALLAVITAIAAPSLSGTLRQRQLADEARRILACTEYARDEALSQGVPIVLWMDPATGRFGVQPKQGYPGDNLRSREFQIHADLHFELPGSDSAPNSPPSIEFTCEGGPAQGSLPWIRIMDRFAAVYFIALSQDGLGYEIRQDPPL